MGVGGRVMKLSWLENKEKCWCGMIHPYHKISKVGIIGFIYEHVFGLCWLCFLSGRPLTSISCCGYGDD
jgi:hypothetical protein